MKTAGSRKACVNADELTASLFDLQGLLMNRSLTEEEAKALNRCFYRAAQLQSFLQTLEG